MEKYLWNLIQSVRTASPLVHNITNYVVMNNTANALLSAGASPVMAHAHAEVEDMVSISSSLVINIGTLDDYWFKSMELAANKAHSLGKPWVLDPVGAGATAYRDECLSRLLNFRPSVIRGNASEIMALAKVSTNITKGVDSLNQSSEAIDAGRLLNRTTGSVVCISGETDIVLSGNELYLISNGHALMQQVTGLGCSASALIGAFIGIGLADQALATAAAMSLIGIAGQIAQETAPGPGSLQTALLDKLYNITEHEFSGYLKIEKRHA